jgi:hypothetical protein
LDHRPRGDTFAEQSRENRVSAFRYGFPINLLQQLSCGDGRERAPSGGLAAAAEGAIRHSTPQWLFLPCFAVAAFAAWLSVMEWRQRGTDADA